PPAAPRQARRAPARVARGPRPGRWRLVVLFPLRSAPTHHYHLRSHQASPASQRFAAWLAAICREAVAQGREFLPAADD
ncbi:hypothetical protein LDY98_12710, partial [Pseudomonas aeruginosa]|nr:hypothetical protein [Pseudomonas aeruginosa]